MEFIEWCNIVSLKFLITYPIKESASLIIKSNKTVASLKLSLIFKKRYLLKKLAIFDYILFKKLDYMKSET